VHGNQVLAGWNDPEGTRILMVELQRR
jgi:hypothetical protein